MSQRRRGHHHLTAASAILLGLTATLGVAVPAHGEDSSRVLAAAEASPEEIGLVLPPVDDGFREYVGLIDGTLTGSDRYSTIRILEDRTGAEIYWDGEPSQALAELVHAAPPGFSVTVVDTPFSPAELRAEVDRLIHTDGVLSARLTPEADSLVVTLASDALAARSTTNLTRFPVTVEEGEPIPTGRFDDPNPMGGALIGISGKGHCTAGFGAKTVGGSARLLTAAHCGVVGKGVTHLTVGNSMGTILGRNITHDAAGVGGGSLAYSNPFVWAADGTPATDNSLMIMDGTMNPVVGDEICLSGAYSGYSCGHIIGATDTWNYTGMTGVPDMIGITGYVTVHATNKRLNGPGDSGGPGVIWTTSGTYAATLTSGIRGGGGAGSCDGVFLYNPFEDANRECSTVNLLTSARSAANAFGLTIETW
ncbi:hypothetical protein [Cellulosimicrobium cellulans]|uniref:hypothetical protein n=1 Tax=Cellulosimicrobium cellulans TaxID=1710 RepID=UPI002406EB54|nr:hypothetical protein [Cellulosimicrobium cellulans]MDF9875992.1 hypothetical protein [Cellulosimicrobium cellulans]